MKTIRVLDNEASDTTHRSTCRYEACIGHDCPRYRVCCGEVD